MGKGSAWSALKRLFKLVELLANSGSRGVEWETIRNKVYLSDDEESSGNEESMRRKFDRDRKALRDIYEDEDIREAGDEPLDGAAIIEKKNGRYVIREGVTFMLPMKLTDDQALALSASVRLVPGFLPSFKEASGELWRKLQRPLPGKIRDKAETLTEAIVPAIPVSRKVRSHILQTVLDAMEKKKVLEVKQYNKAREDDLERCSFSPYALYLKHHSWYVMGEVHGEQGDRMHILRVDRIAIVDVSEKDQPHPCEGDALKNLEKDIRLDYNPFDKKAPKEGYRVKLRITGSFVTPCEETEWFPDEKKTLNKDGTLDYEVTLKGLEAITLWIMRALDSIEIIEPAKLRDKINERVRKYTDREKARQKSES